MHNLAFFLLFCILLSGCSVQKNENLQTVADRGCLDVGCFSWFVRAAFKPHGENKIRLERGMAVAVISLPEKCVLLTNKHIVTGAERVWVSPWSGTTDQRQEEVEATVLYEDPKIDAALLSFAATGGCTAGKISKMDPSLSEPVLLLGQPVHLTGAVTRGIVSGYWQTEHGTLMITDALGIYGFSGSGVLDHEYNIVGLVTGKTSDEKRGFTYIIPPSRLKSILTRSVELAMKKK